ncbi:MAG: Cys-rich repeat protein [Myxococcota bacterium]|jgi:Cys-rich repeat protein
MNQVLSRKHIIAQGASTLIALGAAATLLMGMNSCGGDPPPNSQQCQVAADCEGLPHIECVGSFSCESGQCIYECDGGGCDSDSECDAGMLCIDGECTDPKPEGCWTNDDCSPSEMCVFPVDDCPPGAACTSIAQAGQCVPKPPGGCASDSECAAGEVCDFSEYFPCGADAPCLPAGPGVCVPKPPTGCTDDADCAAGHQCLLPPCEPCPYDAECPPCTGVCEPVTTWECSSDSECGTNQYCDFVECSGCDCLPDADCDCAQVCYGVCKDTWTPPPSGCSGDSDCGMGEQCMVACPDCYCEDDSDCDCGPCFGECVPKSDNGCTADSQCGANQQCQISCAPCWCEDGTECECPCFGECVNVDPPEQCSSDDECGPNATCECLGDPSCPMCDVCFFQCVPTPATWCTSDAECAAGEQCVDDDTWACDCPPGSDCLCPEKLGTCQPTPEPTECKTTGCSGEVCSSEDVYSICIWDPSYICLEFSQCGSYGDDGGCGWKPTPEYVDCLAQFDQAP